MEDNKKNYYIRLATMKDIPLIMDFIDKYWKKDHIMAKDREYFEYEFVKDNKVNFILGIEKETERIIAINGFLEASSNSKKLDIWGSFWKNIGQESGYNNLGMELLKIKPQLANCRYSLGIGDNSKTAVPLLKLFLNKKVAKLNQFYMINYSLDNYVIAVINKKIKKSNLKKDMNIVKIDDFEYLNSNFDIDNNDNIPYKDSFYVKKKFFENPRLKYDCYGILDKDKNIKAFFISRDDFYKDAKALRIVDYYGDMNAIKCVGLHVQNILQENGYEYADFYNLGFDENILFEAGFDKIADDDENIIPNYFNPFEQKNIEIWCSYDDEKTIFYKADGDQDRAN